MMKSNKSIAALLTAGVLIAGLVGCQKKEVAAEQGPAETAGQQIDQAAAKLAQEADQAQAAASQGASNMTEEAGKKIENAGEKMQEAANDQQK
jgi:hypothetical protein